MEGLLLGALRFLNMDRAAIPRRDHGLGIPWHRHCARESLSLADA